MPGRIIVLPEELTNKIAAGEVVERPASIVKELLENALDAGATEVAIELEKGGYGFIKVVDNGEGIGREDVPLAFARYATSKIYQFEDIYRVKSFGFRGEALPSIASISRIEMVTRRRGVVSGTRVIVETGQVKEIVDAGCPVGTSISVSHIFDSVPVRKKFLKQDITEQGHCIDVITRVALSHPEVRMKVVANKREIMNIPATEDASLRISLLLGADFMDHILPVNGRRGSISVRGFVCRPEVTRSSPRHIYCYVNRRFVRDYLLKHAVMTAYKRLIDGKRYPAVVLSVDLPPEDVDVNVHPAKMEVRFKNPRDIYGVIVEALSGALTGVLARTSDGYTSSEGRVGYDGYQARVEEAMQRYTVSSGRRKLFFTKTFSSKEEDNTEQVVPAETVAEGLVSPTGMSFAELDYVGQIAGTYLLFSAPQGLIMLDQHAAHERILFEKFKREALESGEKLVRQRLLIPVVINLPPKEFSFLMTCRQTLKEAGIEVEPFGTDTIVIKSISCMLSGIEPKTIIIDLLEELSELGQSVTVKDKSDKIFAFLACRGAVKANQRLSVPEVAKLCRDLDTTPFSSTCPHGRPVYVSFSLTYIEKMFKRR
ncbi:MAG: DNA mismatch repair endonuclease MutL [Syntrophales bacterium]